MSLALAVIVAWALCLSGMATLSLAMDRHHQQITGRCQGLRRPHRIVLRMLACWLLIWALRHCVAEWGPGVGSVMWCGFLSAGALPVVMILAYWPGRRRVRAAP